MIERLQKVTLGHDGPTSYCPLGDVASLARREIVVDPETCYTEIGVRSFHKGTFHRRTVKGSEFTWQGLYWVKQDDLIFSNIMAWEGAVALATPEDDGCVGNHRMLTCECDRQVVEPAFLANYFKTPEGMAKLVSTSTGTVARNRTLTAASLVSMLIPLPPIGLQRSIVTHLDALADKTRQLSAHLDAIETDADHLLALRFRDAVAGALHRAMGEMAPTVRRSVTLDPMCSYREIGARSFGKGLFAKPDFNAAEATWQKPVWIEENDLIFSNIKAWEGAIALASDEHDGCIASHRYITCVPDHTRLLGPFLLYYLLSDEGLEKVGSASPGTADRNRTLSLGNLAKIEVPVPSIAIQQAFVSLQAHVHALKARHTAIRAANAALLPATLERLFAA